MDIALKLHQQKINHQEFDRTRKGKPQVLGPNTQLRKGADTTAAPVLTDPNVPAAPALREKKKKKKKKREDPEIPATPAAKGKGQGQRRLIPEAHAARWGKGRRRRNAPAK